MEDADRKPSVKLIYNSKDTELNNEIARRAHGSGLRYECGGVGSTNAKYLILSEAPGEVECLKDPPQPMLGPAGRLLGKTMLKYGIQRNHCYITNVVKRKLVLGKDEKIAVDRKELAHWESLLNWEIDQLPNLEYVIILGNYALHALIGEVGITQWRGSMLDLKVGHSQRVLPALCTFNPANIMRNPIMEPMYNYDFFKLKLHQDGKFKKHIIRPKINPTVEECKDYLNDLRATTLPIALDIETVSNETACIGFATDGHAGFCLNFRDKSGAMHSLGDELAIRKMVQEVFNAPGKQWIMQNGSFDCTWLAFKDRFKTPKPWFDTLLAHHTLYSLLPHNLAFLTAQYTTHPYYKDEGKMWKETGDLDQYWEYNVKDAAITWSVHQAELKELQEQGLEDFFFSHVMRLQPHLIDMTLTGIKADVALKEQFGKTLELELQQREQEFVDSVRSCTGDDGLTINPRSSKQLSQLFFTHLGLIGSGTSTNKANRDRIRAHPRTPIGVVKMLNILDSYKQEHKFYSTYVETDIDEDERWRTEWKQYGTQSAPGRLSSASLLWGAGTNLQNQPERAYPMFIADKGYMFSYFDLSQAEARIVAYKWNVRGLIENFEEAERSQGQFDVHRGNASRIFQMEYDDIPSHDRDDDGSVTKRFLGKRCVHGLNYRMAPPKLAEVCGIPLAQANEAYASYHRAFPEIQRAWRAIVDTVYTQRALYNCLGRRLIFLGRITDEAMESVVAFVPQSTIGDKVTSTIYECHDDDRWPRDNQGGLRAQMVLNIHDALVAMHLLEDKEVVQEVMRHHAETPIDIDGQAIVIPAEIKESYPDSEGVHRWSTIK